MKNRLLSLVLLLFTAFGVDGQVPSYVPTNGLVGYWPFNGNANDESGNGNSGTVNGATLTEDRFGNANSAYSFDGVDDFIDLGPYILNLPQEYTIDMWVKFNNTAFGYLFGQATNGEIQIQSDGSGNVTSWNKLTNGGSVSVGTVIPDFTNWHHITALFNNNTKILQFIMDGDVFATTIPPGVNIQNFSGPALFGRQSNFNGNFFNGKLDDIGIWNRVLTADEVLALYNGCNLTPQVVIGNTTPNAFANSTYTCNNNAGSTYAWTVSNGVIASGQGTNTIDVLWGAEGVGGVAVTETTADGCVGDAVVYDVNVQCVVSGNAITGPVGPEAFSNSTYTCNGAANSTYNWTVTNGVIASGQGTNTVNILWASTGLGNVSVVETTAEGCVGTSLSQDVVVIPTNIEELSNALILFPNPVTIELNLQIKSDLIGTDLFVFDALGKQILKQQILSTNTTINTSAFAAGNYVVKVGGVVKRFEVVR